MENSMLEAKIQGQLNEWLERNELLWRQKSRETWLREGDRNSQFFHVSTIIRRRRNAIEAIKSEEGEWITYKPDIQTFMVSKFQQLFTEDDVSFPQDLENLILRAITAKENASICLPQTLLEIKQVIFGMQNLKAPGPDGLPPLFYKRYWPTVGDAVGKCQSAFIPGRWIAENQLIVHELLHSFKRRKVKGGFVAMKVDLQKAYDRINWNFLRIVLRRFGFQEVFVNWIMQCVTSVSFLVLINGGKSKSFRPTRGIRQGDPLSPYLFILCQEVLSRLIDKELIEGNIRGVCMNVGGPAFTHVMYADDIILFARVNGKEVKILDECIEKCRDFKFLQDKIVARLLGWRSETLSWAGRSTLIKSVANAFPTYTFSTFNISHKVCDKLDASTRRIWGNPKRSKIDIWKDLWVPWLPNFTPTPKDVGAANRCLVAACLINQASSSWNIEMLGELFTDKSINAIKRIPIPFRPRPDQLVWIIDPKGSFTVKFKVLLWRIGMDILPTKLNVAKRIGHGDTCWLAALFAANQIASPEPCRDAVWTALAVNQIKLNVDAAWCSVKSSMAVVARDHKGIVLKAWSKMVVADEPLVAETHAIKWAIELASLEDYQNFMVESDAKLITLVPVSLLGS
uniref:Reverse transcriptase domain-containing protein n=1 Tax=Fagus sylvatica TaxID=28930 RepID=A0A2N9FG91_FAGSY